MTQTARKRDRPKVLVVDDSPIVLEIVRDRLEANGFEVTARTEPLGVSQWIADNRPTFVLLDVEMPALTGDALASLLKKRSATQDVRIILHSSLPREKLAKLVQQSGAAGAIQKTDEDDIFMSELRIILRGPAPAAAP